VLPVLLARRTALGYGVANHLAPVLGRRMPLGAVLLGSQIAGLAAALLLTLGADIAVAGRGLAFGEATRAGLLSGASVIARSTPWRRWRWPPCCWWERDQNAGQGIAGP